MIGQIKKINGVYPVTVAKAVKMGDGTDQNLYDYLMALTMSSNYDINVKAINHRGYSTIAPENTLEAYRLSKQMGFNYVEADVSFTSDGVPVLLHDETIDRTSDGTGAIGSMTFEQVRAYDFGSWKSEDYAGAKIPSFEEFILLCRNLSLKPYIELKSSYESAKQVLFDQSVKFVSSMAFITTSADIVEGETYNVYWDDSQYECTAYVFENEVMLGNNSLLEGFSGTTNTGEPFLFEFYGDGTASVSKANTVAITYDIRIEKTLSMENLLQGLVDIVRKHGMLANSTWISFNYGYLQTISNYLPSARLGYIKNATPDSTVIADAVKLKNDVNEVFLDVSYSYIGKAFINACIENGLGCEAWTVNSKTAITSLNPYVTGVTSDSLVAGKVLYDANIQ